MHNYEFLAAMAVMWTKMLYEMCYSCTGNLPYNVKILLNNKRHMVCHDDDNDDNDDDDNDVDDDDDDCY